MDMRSELQHLYKRVINDCNLNHLSLERLIDTLEITENTQVKNNIQELLLQLVLDSYGEDFFKEIF